jgi:hypothetical protein
VSYARSSAGEPATQRAEHQPDLGRGRTSVVTLMTTPSASPITAPTAIAVAILMRASPWAVPGSNGRPPACKARAPAAVYYRLPLRSLNERRGAHSCCALLRFAASKPLPHERCRLHAKGRAACSVITRPTSATVPGRRMGNACAAAASALLSCLVPCGHLRGGGTPALWPKQS